MVDLIYCDTCGGANQPGRRFCFSCGGPLTASTQQGTAPFSTGLLPGSTLLKQRYRLLRTVGKGGMGAVYEAEDTELGDRLVAVKEMSQHNLATAKELAVAADSFKREAHLLAKLHNPHLPSIHDYFTENGRWYLVMSFIPGETLHHYLLKNGGKLPVEEVLHIGIELCEVLAYLHSQQPPIIFRDLKPSNIMRTPDGQIYLIDFGIARHFKPGQMRDTAIFGSLGYAAPEQYGSAQTTPRSDIYSLGVILCQLLTGLRPSITPFSFSSFTSLDIIVPPTLETLVMSMLEVDEDQRPQSMQEVQQELQQIEHAAAYAPTLVGARTPVAVSATSAPAQKQVPRAVPLPAAQPTPQPAPARPQQQPALATLIARAPSRQQWMQQWTKLRLKIAQMLAVLIAHAPSRQQWQKWFLNAFHALAALIARVPVRQRWQKLRLSGPQVLATLMGTVLCALLIIWLDHGRFPTWFSFAAGHVSFRVSMFLILDMLTLVVAIFFGARSGPLVGLLTGGVGTLIGDYIGMAGGTFGWNWDLRVALVGLITGLLLTRTRRHQQPFSRRLINGASALAILVGTAFASYTDLWLHHEPLANVTTIFIIYTAISILVCWLLMVPLFRFFRN
jgi:uncharacterized membrane protein